MNQSGCCICQVADPLGETSKTLALLQEHALDRLETHFLAFEVLWKTRLKYDIFGKTWATSQITLSQRAITIS
jgi:hypothetical protein